MTRRPNVIILEDNPASLILLREIIRLESYCCESFTDPIVFLDYFKVNKVIPDLILIDISLPKMNGLDVLAELNQLPWLLAVKKIAITAMALPEEMEKIKQGGFEEIFNKPISIADIQCELQKIDR